MSALLQHLLPQAGFLAGAAGTGAALHGAGMGDLLAPLDYPRQALWNMVRSGGRALSGEGSWDDALRAVPGALGAGVAGGLMASGVGAPLGILAGSIMGGIGQGVGKAVDEEKFQAPEISDVTGTDEFVPNALVGALTDPLTYAGAFGGGSAGRSAANRLGRGAAVGEAGGLAKTFGKVAEEARPATTAVAKVAKPSVFSPLEMAVAHGPEMPIQAIPAESLNPTTPMFNEAHIEPYTKKTQHMSESFDADSFTRKANVETIHPWSKIHDPDASFLTEQAMDDVAKLRKEVFLATLDGDIEKAFYAHRDLEEAHFTLAEHLDPLEHAHGNLEAYRANILAGRKHGMIADKLDEGFKKGIPLKQLLGPAIGTSPLLAAIGGRESA